MTDKKPSAAAMDMAQHLDISCTVCAFTEHFCRGCARLHEKIAHSFDAFAARAVEAEREALLALCMATPVREWAQPYMDQLKERIRARGKP